MYHYRPSTINYKLNRASVLVMAIWLITVMAIFGVGLARIARSTYRYAKFRVDRVSALCATDSLVAIFKYDRLNDNTPSYDTIGELSEEKEYVSGSVKVTYSIVDEERRLNINTAPASIMKNLPGMNDDKASAILECEFRPFYAREQLLMLDEIDEELYEKIADLITVYGSAKINMNTCSEDVMKALGIKDGLVSKIIDFRKGEDRQLGTKDDGYFQSRDAILSALRAYTPVSQQEEHVITLLLNRDLIDVRSSAYQLKAEITAAGKKINSFSVIIAKEEGSIKFDIIEWVLK